MDLLSHNSHMQNRDQEIVEMRININAISTSVNIPLCTIIQDIKAAICGDSHLQELKAHIIQDLKT